MLLDASEINRGDELSAEVCIIGAGAAGIALADSLVPRGREVIVLESGALGPELATQALYRGNLRGVPQLPLDESRLRRFGGSTNHWAGMCRPLDAEDFGVRSWVAHSGWPIERTQLDPYYGRAHELCGLGPFDFLDGAVPVGAHGLHQAGCIDAGDGLLARRITVALLRPSQGIEDSTHEALAGPRAPFARGARARVGRAKRARALYSTICVTVPATPSVSRPYEAWKSATAVRVTVS